MGYFDDLCSSIKIDFSSTFEQSLLSLHVIFTKEKLKSTFKDYMDKARKIH